MKIADDDEEEFEKLDEDLEDTSVEDLETTLDTLLEESETTNSTVSSIAEIQEGDLLRALSSEEVTCATGNEVKEEIQPKNPSSIEEEIQAKVSQSVKEALARQFYKRGIKRHENKCIYNI